MSTLATALLQDIVWKDGAFRLSPVEEPKKIIHKDVPRLLHPATEANDKLRYSCENLQPMLARAVRRKTLVMEQKMRSHIRAASDQHQALMDTAARLDMKLAKDQHLAVVETEIQQGMKQTETLERQQQILIARVKQYQAAAMESRGGIAELRAQLLSLSRENLSMSLRLQSSRQIAAPTVSGFSLSCSPTPKPHVREDEAKTLRSSLASVRGEAKDFVSLQGTFFLQEMTCEQFFQDCLDSVKREFMRLEQLPKSSKGLKDSLYFQLLPRLRPNKVRSQSQLETRKVEDVMYDTVRHLLDTARVQAHTVSLSVPRSDLEKLRPIERLGLLLAHPKAVRRLHEQVFPTNVLCVRPRSPMDSERETVQIRSEGLSIPLLK